jgi:hypothetical protein
MKKVLEDLRGVMANPSEFELWANDLLDRAHRHSVERGNRR